MIYCETHGKIRGRKARYCPICGGNTITVNLFPLMKLYVDKKGCYRSTGVLCVTALLVAFCGPIVSGVSGCNERLRMKERQRQTMIERMPQAWASLYNAVDGTVSDSNKGKMIEEMLKSNPNPGSLPPEAMGAILDTFTSDSYRAASYILISKYTQRDESKVEK